MKKALLIFSLIAFSFAGFAQTAVTVSSNQFTPQNITINVGETVTWTNTGGFHNVNGTQATFPNNPESFGNNTGTGWTYMHTFNIPGSYDYQCDPHFTLGMTGTVTVNPVGTGIQDKDGSTANIFKSIFPSPASELVTIEFNADIFKDLQNAELSVYNLRGELIATQLITGDQMQVDVSALSSGSIYCSGTKQK